MDKKPFRVQMDFVVAADELDEVTDLHDQVLDAAEAAGLIYEGGFVGLMPAEDVIDGSPLDDHIKGTCPRCPTP